MRHWLLLLALFSAAQAQAATASARAGAIIDALTDPVVKDAAQKTAIVEKFCLYAGWDALTEAFGTPDNPATTDVNEEVKITSLTQLTANQKSQVFIQYMSKAGKAVLRKQAEDDARAAAAAAITGAGNTGEGALQ
jgi:hypothetical protein